MQKHALLETISVMLRLLASAFFAALCASDSSALALRVTSPATYAGAVGSAAPCPRVVRALRGGAAADEDDEAAPNLLPWLTASGGSLPGLSLGSSAACGGGSGVFASRDLEPNEVVGKVPLAACLTAADACADPTIGPSILDFLDESVEYGQERGAEVVALVALLVHVRYGDDATAARERFSGFVDTLPWGDGDEDDSLRHHPLLDRQSQPSPDTPMAEAVELARGRAQRTARMAAELLGASSNEELISKCFRATVLVASRSFDLAAFWARAGAEERGRWRSKTLVPALDWLNHPSRSALAHGETTAHTAAFAEKEAIVDACARHWLHVGTDDDDDDDDEVWIIAPPKLRVPEGAELFLWYGDAGWGTKSKQEWDEGEATFYAQYGFSPWQ